MDTQGTYYDEYGLVDPWQQICQAVSGLRGELQELKRENAALRSRVDELESRRELGPPLDLGAGDYAGADDTSGNDWREQSDLDPLAGVDVDGAIHRETLRRGRVTPDELADKLATKHGLDGASFELLSFEICCALESAGYELEASNNTNGDITRAELCRLTWVYSDAGALADELKTVGQLAPDAPDSYRREIGHALYLRAKRDKGTAHAARYFGKYAGVPA